MYTFSTVIWFIVNVPVLSEAMISVEPSVSTAGNLRTIELRLANVVVPIDKTIVTIAGKPSGIAATARATATISPLSGASPRTKTPIRKVTAAIPTIK